ncbi:MAG: YbjQ family protein [Firmicutes bacterium]|nr:YbjQ family protein [Bacillota bacterium]MBR6824553.1 YbjQ family protein [Bacillota bacterium]MBR7113011.1 YbjQ family protein [Bacillota bacterium]
MNIYTVDVLPGAEYLPLGLVQGSCIQTKHLGADIGQSFKSLVGGELKSYSEMLDKARDTAMQRMVAQAAAMGADAIVGVRISTSAVMQGAAEMLCYGTAIRFKR